jgi:glucoamylase
MSNEPGMTDRDQAPGAPGIKPTWTSSAKDIVSTTIGPSRVWITTGHGILNEVYWPSTGVPQIRDLGFIVATPFSWHEIKRINRYRVELPQPYIFSPTITHEGPGYTLVLQITLDPVRDVVLIRYKLTGKSARLYALLAPHLGNSGYHNNIEVKEELFAWREGEALCLACDPGFSRASAGFVGASDGWRDFTSNGRLTWSYPLAKDGNVALTAELARNEGVMALGFANTRQGARTLALSSLNEGFDKINQDFAAEWEGWKRGLKLPQMPEDLEYEALLSAAVLRVHEDTTFPGATVASLSIPWGNATDSSGGYHLVWPRDAVEVGLAQIAIGQIESAHRLLSYLIAIQREDGSWYQNYFPDGQAYWVGRQIDEVSFPIILAAKLAEEHSEPGPESARMIQRAVGYLVQHGPGSEQDRWEENDGVSPFSLGVQIVALIGGAQFLRQPESAYALSLADYWNERIEDWTYVERGPHSEQGYYVRIGPSFEPEGLKGRVPVKNREVEPIPAVEMIGMDYLYLVRLGLRRPSDPRIRNTLQITDRVLKADMPNGLVAFWRYNVDGYGEQADGRPFDVTGIGRPWPLLAGERGHYDVLAGIDPILYLRSMAELTGPGKLMPEQVWDAEPIPELGLFPGKPTGSAMPLVWAHSEFLKLLVAREQGRPVELLDCVQRHLKERPSAKTWHWRPGVPFAALPSNRDLLIEMPRPFTLRMGFDGWRDTQDQEAQPLPFGFYGVRLPSASLIGRQAMEFTFVFKDDGKWQGTDYRIAIRH